MTSSPKRIGFYGGGFDPVHNAHLFLAQCAVDQLNLDTLLFTPAGGSAYYKQDHAFTPAKHRLAMLELATKSNPKFNVCTIETDQGRFCYTIDTLQQIRSQYPPDTEIILLVGGDWKDKIQTWKDGECILNEYSIAYFPRPGFEFNAEEEKGKKTYRIDMPLMNISSTTIRERVKEGLPVDDLVPADVKEYINVNALYS